MAGVKIVIRMTLSQQMAILDIVMDHITTIGAEQVFVDCSTNPPTETSSAELLALLSDVSELEAR